MGIELYLRKVTFRLTDIVATATSVGGLPVAHVRKVLLIGVIFKIID